MSGPKSKSMSDFLVTFFVDNRAFSQLLSDVLKNKHQALFNETSTKYPLAQKCRFPYLYFKFACLSKIMRLLFPLRYPIT